MKGHPNPQHARAFAPWQGLLTLLAPTLVCAQLPPPPVSPAPVVNLEYDPQGNFKRLIQAPGAGNYSTSHAYDGLHRRTVTTDARSKTTQLSYNGREDLVQVTDPRNLLTQYPRNGLGDATGLVSPDTGTATHTFDAAGNLLTRLDSRGVLASHAYDALNRLTSITYSQSGEPSQGFAWVYDQTGPGFSNGVGRLTSTQFPVGSTTHAYDQQGRMVGTTQTVTSEATLSLSTAYGYDAAGHVTSITYPSGRVLYIPHAGGQPTSMSLAPGAGSAALPLISGLQFEPGPGAPGAVRSWSWQLNTGALAHNRAFDAYGRMLRYPLGGAVRDLTYDAADRIVSYTHWDTSSAAPVPALNQGFGYDELGRLTSVTTGTDSWAIGYDDNGNRTGVSYTNASGASTRNYSTSPTSNRLLSLDNPSRTLSHDAAGNVLTDNQGLQVESANFDLAGRMANLYGTFNGTSYARTGYEYNTLGQRVLKKDLGGRTCSGPPGPKRICDTTMVAAGIGIVFVYDQQGQLLGEYRLQDGSLLREYVWLQGLPVAIIDGSPASPAVYYIQTDHLGTPRVALDRAGRQRWSWVAEPFGNSEPVEDPLGLGSLRINLRMPGQYFDLESGLAYNWHRAYDASTGRYTQSDPIGLEGGINTYSYVGSAPTMFTDPRGLTTPSRPMPKGPELQQCPDPCSLIDKAIEDLVASLKTNWNAMYFDTKLYDNAYSIPNVNVTGTKTTWVGHLDNFYSVQRALKTQIANANRFNCPVSPEAIRWSNVLPPIRPGNSFGPMP